MKIFSSLKTLSIPCLLLGWMISGFAQVDFLLIEDGFGAPGQPNAVPVQIRLANVNPLGGFQLEMNYNSALVSVDSVTATSRLAGMDLFYNLPQPGRLIVLVTSIAAQRIAPGSEAVVQVHLRAAPSALSQAVALSLANLAISDSAGNALPIASANGYYFVTGSNFLRISDGVMLGTRDTVSVNLYNSVALGGLQFKLNFDHNFMNLDTILASARTGQMTLTYNQTQPGEVITLLYSLSPDSISAGSGSLLKIAFQSNVDTVAEPTDITQHLLPQNVVLSNTSGTAVQGESFSGVLLFKYVAPPLNIGNSINGDILSSFQLKQNYPNPFNASTLIPFELHRTSHVTLDIYAPNGQHLQTLVNGIKTPDNYMIEFDAANFASGIYLYRLKANGLTQVKKMLLAK